MIHILSNTLCLTQTLGAESRDDRRTKSAEIEERTLDTMFGKQVVLLPDLTSIIEPDDHQLANATLSDERAQRLAQIHYDTYNIDSIPAATRAVQWNIHSALKEVFIVCRAFPAISDDDTAVLAMAATFHIICCIDDRIEHLPHPTARKAIDDGLQMLHDMSFASSSHHNTNDEPVVSLSSPSREPWSQRRRLHPLRQRLGIPSNHSASQEGSLAPALLGTFLISISRLLPSYTYNSIRHSIDSFWTGLQDENKYRHASRIDSLTVEAYSAIRSRTIGLASFFDVLADKLCPGSTDLSSAPVQELTRLVSKVAELQNNILGLRKDLEEDERFNIIIVRAHAMMKDDGHFGTDWDTVVGECLSHFVRMHNEKVKETVRCWEEIVNRQLGDGVRRFVDAVLGFVVRHYQWAEKSKRYQA
jgi:hypothetical protein